MRIGIDARELCGHPTGAGRYLGGLIHAWSHSALASRHEFVLYAPEPLGLTLDSHRFPMHLIRGVPGAWWEQMRLPSVAGEDHLEAFFAPAYTAPLRLRVPLVVAIHDLSFVAHPEWFRPREGVRRRLLTRRAAGRAQAVVTISEFAKRELIERFGVREDRIHVIPPGVEKWGRESFSVSGDLKMTPVPIFPGLPDPRVLFVGSIFNRRHVPDLIKAVAILAQTHPDVTLDIVGDNRTYPHENLEETIAHEQLTTRVRWHHYVPDHDLRDLYARARAFVFLSEYEGLGLTPLEALSAGVPAVLLDTPVARESCGDAALYVPPRDVAATAWAIERVLFDEATRERLLAAAPAALAKYNWERAARETLKVIEAVR